MKKKAAAAACVVATVVVAGAFVWSHRERTYPNSFSDGPFKTNASLADALAAHGLELPSDAVGTRYMAVTNLETEYPLVVFFTGTCAATQAAVQKMGIPRVADESAMPDTDLSSFAVTEGWNPAASDEWYSKKAAEKRDEVLVVHQGADACKTYIASYVPLKG